MQRRQALVPVSILGSRVLSEGKLTSGGVHKITEHKAKRYSEKQPKRSSQGYPY
jgi:hypothetical protein